MDIFIVIYKIFLFAFGVQFIGSTSAASWKRD